MDETELDRQIGCVGNLLKRLCGIKAKGSITVHLDGGGNLGKVIDTNLKEWRDAYSSVKLGREIPEEEFNQILTQRSSVK
jgi:hypothetical protein